MKENENRAQYRFDPFLQEWNVYNPRRSNRPIQGKNFSKTEEQEKVVKKTWTCPFCPDAPEGAGEWTVKLLRNKYASLNEEALPFIETQTHPLYKTAPNGGKNNVVLYSQDHNTSFGELSHPNIVELIKLFSKTYNEFAQNSDLKYIFIFENRGKEIGTSMHHPHAQIYSFPIIPIKMERKFNSFKQHKKDTENCLMCDIITEELKDKSRIIEENDHFIAEIPFYAHWAFEIHIMSKRHFPSIGEINSDEIKSLATIWKKVVKRMDALKGDGTIMPYVMTMHNAPVNIDRRDLWHFHIEIYTPYRGPDRLKHLAGVELGTNLFISDAFPQQNAKKLRDLEI